MWIADISVLQNHNDYQDKPLAILKADDIKFDSSWNSKPSRWFNTSADKQLTTFSIWSNNEKTIHIDIKDEKEQIIYSSHIHLHKGLNLWKWDNKLEVERALKAEEFKNKDEETPLNKSLTPVSEGVRLGHDTYIQKGKYSLELSSDSLHASINFNVV